MRDSISRLVHPLRVEARVGWKVSFGNNNHAEALKEFALGQDGYREDPRLNEWIDAWNALDWGRIFQLTMPHYSATCLHIMGMGWDEAGRHVFVVGPRLFEMLARTSTDSTPGSLRMPLPSFCVVFPDSRRKHLHGAIATSVGNDKAAVCVAYGLEADNSIYTQFCAVGSELPDPDAQGRFDPAEMRRVITNLITYLNNGLDTEECPEVAAREARRADLEAKADRCGPSKAKKWRSRADRLPKHSVVYVGPGIEREPSGPPETRGVRQHWVRGHWHRFRHGRGRTKVKTRWVRPHLRGDAGCGTTSGRTYLVDGEAP